MEIMLFYYRQALQDLVTFIKGMTKEYVITGPWIVFGCSYAGTLATWLRKLYPNLVAGAVAWSAPLMAKVK